MSASVTANVVAASNTGTPPGSPEHHRKRRSDKNALRFGADRERDQRTGPPVAAIAGENQPRDCRNGKERVDVTEHLSAKQGCRIQPVGDSAASGPALPVRSSGAPPQRAARSYRHWRGGPAA